MIASHCEKTSEGCGCAAIDHQNLTGHILGIIRTEKKGRTGHINGTGEAAKWNPPVFDVNIAKPIRIILMRAIRLDGHRGIDKTGGECVDHNTIGSKITGK